ncbi:hypothetical protein [Parasphingorhabdus sp.]|uniref:hypothetical protein n=1 Tax=Parasphingorhabdus sp. TaxID=2709688 RepID=UPI003A8D70B2
MIAYTMVGTAAGKDRAFALYDSLFEGTGIQRLFKLLSGYRFNGVYFPYLDLNEICVCRTGFATIPVRNQREAS